MMAFNRIFCLILSLGSLITACDSDKKKTKNIKSDIQLERMDDQSIEKNIVDPEQIRKLEIKFLEIENCLSNTECYKTKYIFNDCGKVQDYYAPIGSAWWHYEYDEKCRLIRANGKKNVIYNYTYLDSDSILFKAFLDDNDTLKPLSFIGKFKLIDEKKNRGFYDNKGQLIRDTFEGLYFPCGNIYKGEHIVEHYYFDNGLLSSKQYFDSLKNMVIDERYYYSRTDSIRLNFGKE